MSEILPVPLAAKPIAVFEFVQFMSELLGETAKLTAKVVPPHKVVSAVAMTVGVGFIVIVNVIDVPEQPFKVGVTVTFAVWVADTEGVAVSEILPEPLAAMPTAVLSEIQL